MTTITIARPASDSPAVEVAASLVMTSVRTVSKYPVRVLENAGGGDCTHIEAIAWPGSWPRTSWTADRYRTALTALADMHAAWWGTPPSRPDFPSVWSSTDGYAPSLLREARSALLEIESASWGVKFLSKDRMWTWLGVLDDPDRLLATIADMPQTVIHADCWPGNLAMHTDRSAVPSHQQMGIGPAPYDLASFHSLAKWWFGRVPLTLTEMRNHYLTRLNERLGQNVDRYVFDLGVDAARAWRFAILWPTFIMEHYATLLAALRQLQNAIIEPAFASLCRCA